MKNKKSFEQWCIDNNREDILDRWDYKLNRLYPKEISCSSHDKYWFKCLNNNIHKSELKCINNLTIKRRIEISCSQCKAIYTTHNYLLKYIINIEDTKLSIGNNKKIPMRCPDCGYEKQMGINRLYKRGYSCICFDNISYPEKFLYNFLNQLNIDFTYQLTKTTLKWCEKYKYDFYIPKYSLIIETHGEQHYIKKTSNKWGTIDEIKSNDSLKENIAKENNIINYISLNCSKSELDWIKDNIIKRLSNLLKFNENDINWYDCHAFAISNMVKKSCDLWNNGFNIVEIIKDLKLSESCVRRYLKQGSELKWCNYDTKKTTKENIINNAKKNSKKVICVTTGNIFNSISEAKKQYTMSGDIGRCCKGEYKWSGKHSITGEKLQWAYYNEDYVKQ